MKKITLFLVLALSLTMIGCSKDGEINAFVADFDATTKQMVEKINAGDVDGARTAFDAKKESLKTQWGSIKTARGFQVSAETKKKAEESVTKNAAAISSAMIANTMKFATDKAKLDKLKALVTEYGEIFK
ncbi:MAG: hypothetical protein AAB336_02500 [Acidobacteriota bacterium]